MKSIAILLLAFIMISFSSCKEETKWEKIKREAKEKSEKVKEAAEEKKEQLKD